MEKYLFSTGVIREVEKKLFDYNDMERMIDAPDVSQSFKIFNELSYADELLDMENPEQYKEILAHDLNQVKDFLLIISPDVKVTELILAPYDFHNLKIVFKAKLAGLFAQADKKDVNHLSSLGSIAVEKLVEIILKQNTKLTLSDDYNALVKEAQRELEKKHQPQEIDSYFDQKYFIFILKRSRELKDEFLIKLIKSQIDIANIKIIIRSRLLDRSPEDLQKDIIPEGSLNGHDLLDSYSKELAGIIKSIAKNFTEAQIISELNKFLEHQEFWQLEKALDNYLVRLIKESKMKLHGPRVLIAYFLAKKNAIRNIRVIMAGKINHIEAEEIKERVGELY